MTPTLVRLVMIGIATLGLAACSTTGDQTASSSGFGGDGSVTVIDPADRAPAPEITGDRLGGGTITRTDFTGRVTVINIWASWCGPCRKEAPELVEAARELRDVDFLGIAVRDNESSAQAFDENYRIPYPSVLDPDGELIIAFNGIVHASALPYTIVIDSDGKIAAVIAGATTAATLQGVTEDVERGTGP